MLVEEKLCAVEVYRALNVENCEDLNKSKNTSSNDNNVESIRKQPTYAEIARRAVK